MGIKDSDKIKVQCRVCFEENTDAVKICACNYGFCQGHFNEQQKSCSDGNTSKYEVCHQEYLDVEKKRARIIKSEGRSKTPFCLALIILSVIIITVIFVSFPWSENFGFFTVPENINETFPWIHIRQNRTDFFEPIMIIMIVSIFLIGFSYLMMIAVTMKIFLFNFVIPLLIFCICVGVVLSCYFSRQASRRDKSNVETKDVYIFKYIFLEKKYIVI